MHQSGVCVMGINILHHVIWNNRPRLLIDHIMFARAKERELVLAGMIHVVNAGYGSD